jgi:hypothetical protein
MVIFHPEFIVPRCGRRFAASGRDPGSAVAQRLERIYRVAVGTGQLARFVVFGSFVSDKREPADVDVFLLMEDTFDVGRLTGEARVLFDHAAAQAHFGASVFWLRPLAALGGDEQAITGWQIKRDGTFMGRHRNRGGKEMIANDQELKVTLERISRFQEQVAHLRRVETNPQNYHGAVSGFLAEIDRMQLEVREYLSIHPTEVASTTSS